MDRILVEVMIPAVNRSYDFDLPAQARASEVTAELVRIVQATRKHVAFDKENTMLCDLEKGRVVPPEAYLSDAGIRDSHRLMLL